MTRKLALAVSSSLLAVALVVPVASAAQPTKTTQPFWASLDRPAGTVCDFELFETFTGTDVVTEFNDRVHIHETITVTHTNVDMGYTLTESYVTNFTEYPDSLKVVGITFHLRDASGKIVVVQAGHITYHFDGTVTHTPGIDLPLRGVLCTALGGNAIPLG